MDAVLIQGELAELLGEFADEPSDLDAVLLGERAEVVVKLRRLARTLRLKRPERAPHQVLSAPNCPLAASIAVVQEPSISFGSGRFSAAVTRS
jgi:hypothetical protein